MRRNALIGTVLLLAVISLRARGAEFFAAPDGTAAGDGSVQKPWDLQTALNQPPAVKPGDTIWLRGGTYTRAWDDRSIFVSNLIGAPDRPIVVRQWPGERATLDGGDPRSRVNWTVLQIGGAWAWYWGFEVTDSNPTRVDSSRNTWTESSGKNGGIKVTGPHVKLIHLVVHDTTSGIDFWAPSEGSELYGNIIYYCGWQGADRAHGHGCYTQNKEGTKILSDNITFDCFGWGLHAYGSGNAFVRDYDFIGNVSFNNGSVRAEGTNTDNLIVVGGAGGTKRNIRVEDNFTYNPPTKSGGGSMIGWNWDGVNLNAVVRNNYFIGGYVPVQLWHWNELVFTGNTVVSNKDSLAAATLALLKGQTATKYEWDRNRWFDPAGRMKFNDRSLSSWPDWKAATGLDAQSVYSAEAPKGAWVFVRPSKYEPGRGHVIVYNWDRKDKVRADVSNCGLKDADRFEVRDAQNFFGPPVAGGLYDGKPVAIPMTGLAIADPVGKVPIPPKHTAPEFGVFVVLKPQAPPATARVAAPSPQPPAAAQAVKSHPEVLLLGPQEGKYAAPYEQLLDILVEYGIHIEADDQDRLPSTLPDDLSGYKVIVMDADHPALKDPISGARLDQFRGRGGAVVYHRPPRDLTPYNDKFLWLYANNNARAAQELAKDLTPYKAVVADVELPALRDPQVQARLEAYRRGGGVVVYQNSLNDVKWYRERQLWLLLDNVLHHNVRMQHPAFLERNASRPDKDVILNQAKWLMENHEAWVPYGNDVVFLRLEAMWTAARLYQREDLKKDVIAVLDQIMAERGDAPSPVFSGVLLPIFKEPANERFLKKCLAQMRSAEGWRRRAASWRESGPYFRCEEMSGLIEPAQRAGVLGESEFLQPAIDLMKVGHDTLFDESTGLWAHCGVRGRWKGLPWGRGQGWLLYGLVSILENTPRDHPDYRLLQSWLEQTAEGLRRTQDPETGLWRNIVDRPASRLEISGTGLIVRHLCRAWRAGALRSPFVPDMLARAWKGIKAHTFQQRSCTQAYASDAGCEPMYYLSLPQAGSANWAVHAGAEYVATFGPLTP